MRVEVRLFATLVDYLPPHGCDGVVQLEVPEDSTVAEVTGRLGIPADLARVVLVNGRDVAPEQRLAKQDVVTIFPPLAGGGPASVAPRVEVSRTAAHWDQRCWTARRRHAR